MIGTMMRAMDRYLKDTLEEVRQAVAPAPWERRWAGMKHAARLRYNDDIAQVLESPKFSALNVIPNIGFAQELGQFAAEFGGGVSEVVRWFLYSYNTYLAAGHTELIFFSTPVAQATNGYGDTNMQQAGAMAGNEAFVILAIRAIPQPAQADYDTAAAGTPVAFGQWNEVFQRNVWIELRISDKLYQQGGPLIRFPQGDGPGTVIAGNATVTRNVAWFNNGHPSGMATYKVDPPLLILPTRTFNLTSRWRTALAVASPGKLGFELEGYRLRVIQ